MSPLIQNNEALSPEELSWRQEEQKRKLDGIKPKLAKTDQLLVHLMARRIQLALRVAKAKHPTGAPTFRAKVEDDRLDDVERWAIEEKINPNFPRSLLYMIMDESCKVQSDYRESIPRFQKEDYSPEKLRANLLLLTEKWAPRYDESYAKNNSLKGLHVNFESSILSSLIHQLPKGKREVILDIGCATGRELLKHRGLFKKAIGYDISPHMIERAEGDSETTFSVHDVETGIPLLDASVSCVYMNHGTASDISGIRFVLQEIRRVLKPGGVFFLSFYNADGLMYQAYLPWPPVLGVEVDREDHCIEVACNGEILPVYARAYSVTEAEELLPSHMVLTQTLTHPTVGSIVPKDVFEEPKGLKALSTIDRTLSQGELGAYVILTGRRD